MFKLSPPAPTASAIGPCPTIKKSKSNTKLTNFDNCNFYGKLQEKQPLRTVRKVFLCVCGRRGEKR